MQGSSPSIPSHDEYANKGRCNPVCRSFSWSPGYWDDLTECLNLVQVRWGQFLFVTTAGATVKFHVLNVAFVFLCLLLVGAILYWWRGQYLTRETFGFFLSYQIPGCSGKATTTSQVCLPEAISTAPTLHCLHALITWGNPHHFQSNLNYPDSVQMKRLQISEPLPVDWARSMCRVWKPALLTPTLGAGISLFKTYAFDHNL